MSNGCSAQGKRKRIIGIDPGLAATGIAIVEGAGIQVEKYSLGHVTTSKDLSLPNRLESLYSEIKEILKASPPDLMVVEDVFSLKKYPKSAILLGKVTGVILLAGCHAGLPVMEIPVREAKRILTGNGNADKKQLERSVRHMLNRTDPISPFHASDAAALALIGFYRMTSPLMSKASFRPAESMGKQI